DDFRQRAFVGDAGLDALRHQLPVLSALAAGVLEIAVAAARPHGADGTHAAVHLVAAALVELNLARSLVGPGKQAAHHHSVGAGGDGLDDVAGVADAAVGNDRNAVLFGHVGALPHRRQLWNADAGHDPGRADAAAALADLDAVRPRLDQGPGALAGGYVARDDGDPVAKLA